MRGSKKRLVFSGKPSRPRKRARGGSPQTKPGVPASTLEPARDAALFCADPSCRHFREDHDPCDCGFNRGILHDFCKKCDCMDFEEAI